MLAPDKVDGLMFLWKSRYWVVWAWSSIRDIGAQFAPYAHLADPEQWQPVFWNATFSRGALIEHQVFEITIENRSELCQVARPRLRLPTDEQIAGEANPKPGPAIGFGCLDAKGL